MFRTKVIHVLFLIAFLIGTFSISGCGSNSDNGINLQGDASNNSETNNSDVVNDSTNDNSNSTKKYLARNVIFDFSIASKAYADEIDTVTKVPAENVIFEKTSESDIESDNVQDALEEITLKLSKVIIGTWSIMNYNYLPNVHVDTGKVIFNEDGTFDLESGSFAAIGMGSASSSSCAHTDENQTYEYITDEFAIFTHYNPNVNPPVKNAVIPQLIKLRKNEIIFLGSGGCGASSKQRVSILTRVAED